MLRKWALTSSTSDSAIAACSGDEDALDHQDDRRQIKELLGRIPTAAVEDDEEQEQNVEGNEETSATEDDAAGGNIILTVDGLLSSEAMIAAAKSQLEFDEANIDKVREVLTGLGHTLSKAAAETTKKTSDLKAFRAFLDADPRLRKHYFKGKKVLEKIAKTLGIPDIGSTAKAIQDSIQGHLESHPFAVIEVEETSRRRAKTSDVLDWGQFLSYTVWSKAYLNPLKGSAKKYTRRGHQLECHVMRSCIKDHLQGETPIKISKACTVPLVERVGCRYAKDSIDFVGFDEVNDRCIGIEVKARVSNRRAQQETQHIDGIRRLLQCDCTARQRRVKYFQVEADSPQFSELVDDTHEAVQVLHHFYVYSFDYVLLLVGDNSGSVIYGLFVKVSASLREAYGNVLKDVYMLTLRWAYEPNVAMPSDEEVSIVLDEITINSATVDLHSFHMDVALWKDIVSGFQMPLPRLKRIIPLIFAIWNAIKGGSDATTNLIWHCIYSVPGNENQSVCVARMMSIIGVILHRMEQLSTAKDDLAFYGNTKNFRDLATGRRSFKKSLTKFINLTTRRSSLTIDTVPAPGPATAVITPIAASPMQRRSQADIERLTIPRMSTTKTPKRNVQKKMDQMQERLDQNNIDAMSKFFLQRALKCPGFHVTRTGEHDLNGKGGRGTCALCAANTHDYCLGCHQWLCGSLSIKACNLEEKKSHVVVSNPTTDEDPINCSNTCFFQWHRRNQQAAVKALEDELAAGMST